MLGGTGGGAPPVPPAFLMVAVTSWDDLRPPTAEAEEEVGEGRFNGNVWRCWLASKFGLLI